jgi:hypothetical protein
LLGYEPQDDFTNEYPGLKDLHLGDRRHSDLGSKSGLRDDL